MTSSRSQQLWLFVLFTGSIANAWAGLGENEGSIAGDRMRLRAFHSVAREPQYAVHELKSVDGSRVRQYAASNGRVFAVSWSTKRKPDLSALLGDAFPSYASAAKDAAMRGGIQRHFRQDGADLVLRSSGRLHVFRGFAYRPSMMPKGLSPQSLGLG